MKTKGILILHENYKNMHQKAFSFSEQTEDLGCPLNMERAINSKANYVKVHD